MPPVNSNLSTNTVMYLAAVDASRQQQPLYKHSYVFNSINP
jgi:hypothetical protein